MPSRKLDFLFFDAGGGHRAAATALEGVIADQYPDWRVRLVNLQEVLEELDIFHKVAGVRMQDIYNLVLKKGWTLGTPQMTRAMHLLIRTYHRDQVRLLERFWRAQAPDLVVSLIPNFGRAIYQGLRAAQPAVPLVTILTDLADYPPHFWIEPGQDQYYVCGTAKALSQARAMGYGPDRAFAVSGMILNPKFYGDGKLDRVAERQRLGLDPALPAGLILFGGQGSTVMRPILERVEAAKLPVQFIVICGKNDSLRAELSRRRWAMPVFVEGFTSEVPYYMRLSDFFIGKPGPGFVSEAAHMRLPVILERNAWTLPQERYNTDWVREQQAGIVLGNFREIADAIRALLADGQLERFRANLSRLNNRAVFEIPPVLERLLEEAKRREDRSWSASHSPKPA